MAEPSPNNRLLHALAREPVDATPVWIMRQAGRYLPEYRELRARAGSFMALCTTPEFACEVSLQPLARFALDAAIVFSDILTVPHAMGLGLHFVEGHGPRFEHPLRDSAAIDALPTPDPETELRYVVDTVRAVRRELDGRVPLIGFSGSPWTLATYMVEGGSPGEFRHVKGLAFDAPASMHKLLGHLAHCVATYLAAQAAAGAQVLMMFDTWGGVLSTHHYRTLSLAYMTNVIESLRARVPHVPVIVFTKGGGLWIEEIAATGCAGVGLDWTIDLGAARARTDDSVALQGNMDPCMLYASHEHIRDEVSRILQSYGRGSGHVFNLGHGIHPAVDPEHLGVLVDAVHELSRPYHGT